MYEGTHELFNLKHYGNPNCPLVTPLFLEVSLYY